MEKLMKLCLLASVASLFVLTGCAQPEDTGSSSGMTEAEIDNLVRRSYQYVAMYNVINKNAMFYSSQTNTDGWNRCFADTALKDHTYQAIARPNNDTLYAGCMLDLRAEPVIIEYPAFDSKFAVLETSAYDHYVDIPLSTTKADFGEPTRILFATARTGVYSGEPVEGVDRVQVMTGDFAVAFLRIMPHAAEPERMQKNLAAMEEVRALTLSEFLGGEATQVGDPGFPAVGTTDLDTFENNFLEVMQFVVNHATFDPEDPMDQGVLAALAPLGVEPGKKYDPGTAARVDGQRLAAAALAVQQEAAAIWSDPGGNPSLYDIENGFFIPNDRKKYSVGENAGFKLDDDGGIEIHIAAERPDGVPEENWLPVIRRDEALDLVMRIYAPDLERLATWGAPKAEKL
jgi:hypothetical protein